MCFALFLAICLLGSCEHLILQSLYYDSLVHLPSYVQARGLYWFKLLHGLSQAYFIGTTTSKLLLSGIIALGSTIIRAALAATFREVDRFKLLDHVDKCLANGGLVRKQGAVR